MCGKAGIESRLLSGSQRAVPDPDGPQPKTFRGATPDGSKLLFTSCEKLTDDSTAVAPGPSQECGAFGTGPDLYMADVDSGDLTLISVDNDPSDGLLANVEGVVGQSADGSDVYFVAENRLDRECHRRTRPSTAISTAGAKARSPM